MIHYINPHCKIELTKKEIYQVIVNAEIAPSTPKDIHRARSALLLREAKKDPLMAMAFILWMAKKGDAQSKNLRELYKGYRKVIENGDTQFIRAICEKCLNSPETDPLVAKMCLWITLKLDNRPIPKRLLPAAKIAEALFPSIVETLFSSMPELVVQPQEVVLPAIKGKHNAFPDLIKHNGTYYACFREANTHVGHKDEGIIRILKGAFNSKSESWRWESSGVLSKEGIDLRDPKFFVDGKNALRLMAGGSIIDKDDETTRMVPHTAMLTAKGWKLSQAKADPSSDGPGGQWIWRVTWNTYDNTGYGLSYGQHSCVNVVATKDGIVFKKVASIALPPLTELNEGTLRFKEDGTAAALIRTRRNGIIAHASSSSGYKEWTCHRVPFRLGGPDFLIDSKRQAMWAATRHFFMNDDNTLDEATIVAKMEEDKLVPLLRLPSSYDCGYPGIVLEDDGSLTVIYYSSPTTKTSRIYICRVCVS